MHQFDTSIHRLDIVCGSRCQVIVLTSHCHYGAGDGITWCHTASFGVIRCRLTSSGVIRHPHCTEYRHRVPAMRERCRDTPPLSPPHLRAGYGEARQSGWVDDPDRRDDFHTDHAVSHGLTSLYVALIAIPRGSRRLTALPFPCWQWQLSF